MGRSLGARPKRSWPGAPPLRPQTVPKVDHSFMLAFARPGACNTRRTATVRWRPWTVWSCLCLCTHLRGAPAE
jgi:hypothetical protein